MPPPFPSRSENEEKDKSAKPASPQQKPPPYLPAYPSPLSRCLNLTLFPLDITTAHVLTREQYTSVVTPRLNAGSPLAEWTEAFLAATWRRTEQYGGLSLHDPLCVWYAIIGSQGWAMREEEDVRVETAGQWTRGACIVDRRGREKKDEGEVAGDHGGWQNKKLGNRMRRALKSPGNDETEFAARLLERVFGVERTAA